MCGIAGKLNFNQQAVSQTELEKMADAISHRGPDDRGFFVDQNLGFGFCRLSIIDLSPAGHQPMQDVTGRYTLIFNGEIYNFSELRKELEVQGVKFQSKTDSETILYLYAKHGVDCVKFLRGMFAFAIWDNVKRELFVARDRLGKKPLKYYKDENCFIFASELKAILKSPEVKKEIDLEAIDEYLTYQYVPHPKTGFKNIFKLEPAHYLLIKSDGSVTKQSYWDLEYKRENYLTEKDWQDAVEAKLKESVKMRMVSDVPLGAHLSGGIDSSLIVAIMAKEMKEPVKTFSIGFPEKDYNELHYAKLISESYGTNHQELIVEPDAIALLPKLAQQYEEPYADSSALPTWYLSEMTRKHVTVALNGDGGDENFAGYTRYNAMKLFQTLAKIPFKKQLASINSTLYQITKAKVFQKGYRFLDAYKADPMDFYLKIIGYFSPEHKEDLYSDNFKSQVKNSHWRNFIEQYYSKPQPTWLDKILYTDIKTYLPDDLLVKVDIASMAHSLEVRSPFLDHEFMELAAQIPDSLKLRGHNKKYLLKQIAYKYLPKECIDRPKQGFGVPLEHWFRGNLTDYVRQELLDPEFLKYSWFKKEGIEQLINEHKTHKHNHGNRLWALLVLKNWLRVWFE